MSDNTHAAMCVYCGETIIYDTREVTDMAAAHAQIIEHDQQCDKNPLVSDLARHKRMFAAACEQLGNIQQALGSTVVGIEPALMRELVEERDALAARNIGLIQQCKAAEHQRDTHLNKLRTLNHGDASEAWHWMNDGNDKLESLTCPILISAEDLKGIFEERDALAALFVRLQDGATDLIHASSEEEAGDAMELIAECSEKEPRSILARRDVLKKAEGLRLAADFIEQKATDYDAEHGSTDPSTGHREYPGDGAEYYNEMMELADDLRQHAEGHQ